MRDSYLRPSNEQVLGFRTRVDRDTNAALADELELRVQLLRDTIEFPEEDRRPYIEVADFVANYTTDDDWRRGRVARRIWLTGESIMHANFVLFGTTTGTGCPCNGPACTALREAA